MRRRSILPVTGPAPLALEQMVSPARGPRAAPRSTRLCRAARSGPGFPTWLAVPKGSEPTTGGCNLWACRGRFLARDQFTVGRIKWHPPSSPVSF